MATDIIGTGIAVTFGTSGFSAELTAINSWGNLVREAIETTKLSVTTPAGAAWGNRTYKPSIAVDPGELDMTFKVDPDLTPLINSTEETLTLTWPLQTGQATSTIWSGTGFCTDYSIEGMTLDNLVVIQMKFKMTGEMSITVST